MATPKKKLGDGEQAGEGLATTDVVAADSEPAKLTEAPDAEATLAAAAKSIAADPILADKVTTLQPATTPAHYTRCTVVGSDVVSMDRTFRVGDVADFPNSDVASLPDFLVPVTE